MREEAGLRPATPPRAPRRFPRMGAAALTSLVLLAAGAGAAGAATQVTVSNPGGLTAVGPVNGDNGFPAWYEDSKGTRVELCLDDTNPLCGFLPGTVPDPSIPISFPDNFPDEAFYFRADSTLTLTGGPRAGTGKAALTLALEGAFLNAVQPGDQQVFARQRIFVTNGPANSTLTFKEPYGTITVDTDSTGKGRITEDISPAVGNFLTPLKGNLGPFLKWDTGAPEGYLGDPAQAHAVTGGPFGNTFSVTGGGLDLSTDQFTVQGKISTNSGVNADEAIVNGDKLDVFATSSASAQLQVEGTGLQTTPMVTDPGTGRFYARVPWPTSGAPTSVKVVNISDKPASSSTVDVTRPSGITITKASYDGTTLTVAADSANGYPVKVVGVGAGGTDGTLTDNTPQAFSVTAPGATVTVKNDLGSASLPVTVTGGAAMDAALPPTPPAADPGPVVDQSPNNPAGTKAAATIAQASLSRAQSTTVDGSTSTNGGAGPLTYKWSQLPGGPKVTFSSTTAVKPTVSVPFFTSTSATKPADPDGTNVAKLQLEVTDSNGATSTATVDLTVVNDAVVVGTAKHRLGTELRVSGTATLPGNTATLVPQSNVVVYDTTSGTPVKLGTAPVDTLNAFDVRLKPGPGARVRTVLIQSTRGGSATATLATR